MTYHLGRAWQIFQEEPPPDRAILPLEVIFLQAPLALLGKIFDPNPSPVFYAANGRIQYHNPAGQLLLSHTEVPPLSLFLLQGRDSIRTDLTIAGVRYHLDVSPLEDGRLAILQPQGEIKPVAPRLSEQLRRRLNLLLVTTEALAAAMTKDGTYAQHRRALALQMQSICQLVYLARQMELLGEDWSEGYPRESVDLRGLCARVTQDAADLSEHTGVAFSYQCNEKSLMTRGNPRLLEWMLLALISNSVRAAGPKGAAGLRLTTHRDQAQITIWDSGPGLPLEQLEKLFQMGSADPMAHPGEGARLGMYLAREIALYHQGSLLTSNRQPSGAALSISLPLSPDASLSLQSPNSFASPAESFPPAVVALSEVLPWQVFAQLLED